MAVFRVERNKGYTVMSNHHLRNKELSLKAKGLLSQMLSLPEDWDYTLKGLSLINREKIDAIREGKLMDMSANRGLRDENGQLCDIVFGTFFLCGSPADCDHFTSLTPEQIQRYQERFYTPEMFWGMDGRIVCLPQLVSKSTSRISYVIGTIGGFMRNYIFGYARVSTEQQNLDRQIDALKKYGCDVIYNEKMTGTKRDRPELAKMLDRMTEGDTVVIESLSRLGRSTKDLIELTELFQKKDVHLVSLKEQIDTSTSTGILLFTLMSAIAQFERDVIADRTREGLCSARARGKTGGRPKVAPDAIRKAVKLYNTKQYSVREIEELTGVKKSTLYRRLSERQDQ